MCCADEYMPELELQTTIVFIGLAEKNKKGQKVCLKSPEILHSNTSCADKQLGNLSNIS